MNASSFASTMKLRWLLVSLLLCVFASTANSLDSCMIPSGATKTINEHSTCRQVTNNHASGRAITVPTKTAAEWSTGARAFINAPPPGVTLAACSESCTATIESTSSGITGTGNWAADGDTAVFGVQTYNPGGYANRGIAYVYVRSGATWVLQATLEPSDTPAVAGNGPGFGGSVAISGNTIAVGAPGWDNGTGASNRDFGAVYIFTRSGTTWTEQQKIIGGGATGNTEGFGRGVAVDGDRFIASTDDEDGDGYIRIYKRTGTTWAAESAYLAIGHEINGAVTISGTTALACYSKYNTTYGGSVAGQGAIRVFYFNGSSWSLQTTLVHGDPEANDDFCSDGMAIDGDTIVASARKKLGSETKAGALYVFTRSGSTWTQEAKLQPADLITNDRLGNGLKINGNVIAAGIVSGPGATSAGSIYVFTRSGTTWTQHSKFGSPAPVTSGLFRPIGLNGDRLYTIDSGTFYVRSYTLSCGGGASQCP